MSPRGKILPVWFTPLIFVRLLPEVLHGVSVDRRITFRFQTHKISGFDYGVGHSLLLLYDAKAPYSQKSKGFNGLGHYLFNTFYKFIINYNIIYHSYNYLIFLLFLQCIEIKWVYKRLKCNGLR